MKHEQKEFLKILTDYQGIIHKVNLSYKKTLTELEELYKQFES